MFTRRILIKFGVLALALSLVGLTGANLSAAVTNTQVLASATRGPGTFTTPTFTIPANILYLSLSVNVSLADKLSVGKSLTLDVQHSSDGGTTWSSLIGVGWSSWGPGGFHMVDKNGVAIDNPDPSCSLGPQQYIGDTFRIVVTLPQALTFGATVAVTT
jgi:hypothetical protein